MAFKPSEITREHVLKGIEEINRSAEPLTDGTRWEAIIDGKSYPPKEVMRFAREQFDGSKDWPKGGGWPTNEFLEKMGFEVKEKSLESFKNIIQKYKELIKINHLEDEKYKWELLYKFHGKPNLDAPDLLSEIKSIKFSNLIYAMGSAVLYHLVTAKPEEMRSLFRKLFDENTDLTERIKSFNIESLEIYRSLGETLQHHQDERTIACYLTFFNPEKYTFYKYSFYKKLCKLLNEKQAKKNEKYPHYLLLINRIIEEYIQGDLELIELVKNFIPEYYDGSNNLLLAQDILYQMLDNNPEVNEINVKEGFIDWMIANVSGGNYFVNQFGSEKERLNDELNSYEEKYKSEFNTELFIVKDENYDKLIDEVSSNIYNTSTSFNNYSKGHYSGRPTAILGKKQYLTFLKEHFLLKENDSTNETINEEKMNFPLNQILYGPPGTGKTYNTINKAIAIANPDFDIEQSRDLIKVEYERLVKTGQIVFTTFHQSMSYEDFIEGIKPETKNEKVTYEIIDGVFKKLCKEASAKKISKNFDDSYSRFIEEVMTKGSLLLETPTHKKKFKVIINSNETAVAIPDTEKGTNMGVTKEMSRDYVVNGSIRDWKPYTTSIGEYIKKHYPVEIEDIANSNKKFVLIIDEINRGNVSQIFGELITLIEEDKRVGKDEALEVTLPYSKDKFGVPANLYIIGTMNTADRSVESLDSALRRRFSFEEMEPKPYLIKTAGKSGGMKGLVDGIDLEELLNTINTRIEKLIDKDHRIGHSYFLKVHDSASLHHSFKNEIIPLLEEYFFGDFGKIGLVLGSSFVEKINHTFSFAKFDEYDTDIQEDLKQKSVFKIRNETDWKFSEI